MLQKLCLYALLFLTPFVVYPLGISHFEAAKVIFVEIIIIILVLTKLLVNSHEQDKSKKLPIFFLFPIGILVLLQLVAPPTYETFFGNPFRLQGMLLILHLIVFAYITSASTLQVPRFVPYLATVALITSAFLYPQNASGRAVGSVGEANAFAASFLFFIPFLYMLGQKNKKWLLFSTLLIVSTLGVVIFMAQSRSALMALVAQLLFLLTLSKTKLHIRYALLIPILIFVISLALPFLERERIWENRTVIWETALHAGLRSPLIGHGFGNIHTPLSETAFKISNTVRFMFVDSSHNIFLDWWVQGGAIGILTFLAIIVRAFRIYMKHKNIPELAALFGILIALSFNPASVTSLVPLWWLLGTSQIKS